eukprot:CAMPEP_0177606184 /NCGR_PEP_ID=MMETSP0419_2-20121207/17157_1 /TAXON_ID=582737 /ORGANISM="Tetraselmis sp., Strain GSL018" /LENGTH=301 /DNA_ID=CAMNT_0019100499 /DNA_START=614 /DNA_END=1516 /DNA_ORIENTATION=-
MLAHLYYHALASLQLLARLPVEADPCRPAGVLGDLELDLGVVREDNGAERQRVRAHRREHYRADVGVHHRAAGGDAVGSAARRRREEDAVRLNLGEQLALLVALYLGEVGVGAAVHHDLVHHLELAPGDGLAAAVDLAAEAHAEGDVDADGARLLVRADDLARRRRLVGAPLEALLAKDDPVQHVLVVRKVVVGEEPERPEVERDDRRHGARAEEGRGVEDDAVAAEAHDKVDPVRELRGLVKGLNKVVVPRGPLELHQALADVWLHDDGDSVVPPQETRDSGQVRQKFISKFLQYQNRFW